MGPRIDAWQSHFRNYPICVYMFMTTATVKQVDNPFCQTQPSTHAQNIEFCWTTESDASGSEFYPPPIGSSLSANCKTPTNIWSCNWHEPVLRPKT
jgi:hypothetical protein